MKSENHLKLQHDCDAIRDLIADYAFGLTDAEQTRLVEVNLTACPEATAQLAEYRQIQEAMRAAVPQHEPAPALAERLMTAVAEPAGTPAIAPTRPRVPLAWLAAAAAALALIISNGYWLTRVDDLTRRHDALVAQPPVQDDSAFVLTTTANLRWVRLPPKEENSTASAFLMWNAESKIGLMYARDFPALSTGKTYQLWLTRGEERKSVGTFRVDENGIGALLFESLEPIDKFTWARITAEPENGSEQPGENIVVIGQL
jgi:Anti-sigma-K factor rskA